MKVKITEYDEKGKVLQILEYCSYAQQETYEQQKTYYSDMIPAKENEDGKKESRSKKQTT